MVNQTGTWDLPGANFRNPNLGYPLNNSNVYNNSSMLSTPIGRVYTSPPPVPARPNRSFGSGFSSYSSPYSSYGSYFPSYGGYGGFGGGYGFGGYRTGYNSFGCYGNSYPESRFIQLAEESSRPAFQTIQSLLQAFSSVTMMFESSFHAIYSSYMSVLGVADNLGKLRTMFGQIFSALALIRGLKWFFRRVLFMFGINKEDFAKESVWSEALSGVQDVNRESRSEHRRAWPTLLFLSVIIGGPYLLFKLMSELYPNVTPVWVPAEEPGSLAVALYDFHAASDQELSFQAQQKLMIAPKKFQPSDCPGWILACNESQRAGLVPSNYVGMIMQSEKTGQTYIEHNGQTFQPPLVHSENSHNTVNDKETKAEHTSKLNEVHENEKTEL